MASSTKPTYLGLLNAIAVGESAAEPFFLAWAETTKDKRLAKALKFVAMREGEHGKAFAKRMLELGYEVRVPDSDAPSKSVEIARSSKTDVQKFKAFKLGKGSPKTDVFDTMFADKTIDPTTGSLLGRYIAEERDSTRRLAVEYDRLAAKEKTAKAKKATAS
jgi:rubrerythrin